MQKACVRSLQLSVLIGCLLFPGVNTDRFARAADVDESKLDGLKCFIMVRKDVKGKKVVDYKDGKLFVCCSSCAKRIERDPSKYEAKANFQLVYTGQYNQHACPLTGKDVTKTSPEFKVDADGQGTVTVRLASDDLVAKLAAMDVAEQVTAIFGPNGFEAGKFSAE